jgi:hypothetical protein
MGLTIHYQLQCDTRSTKKTRDLVARLRARALDLPLEQVDDIIELTGPACQYQQYERDHPSRWLLIQAGQFVADPVHEGCSYSVTPLHVIAFSTWPGKGCEEANFGFCRYPGLIKVEDPYVRGRTRSIRTRLSGWCWGPFARLNTRAIPNAGGYAISSAVIWRSLPCLTMPGRLAFWTT